MDTLEICYMSAGDLSKLVQNKEISPVEIIEAHLTRIDATEPVLNSFITLLADEARGAALQAEKDIQAGRYKGPLHGIPVALKDLYNTGGVRTTSGSRIFDNFIPTEDCTVAAKFQQAGAILVGKLNMHPFAYGPTGENLDYGHMHNPWNPDMVTGGSRADLAPLLQLASALSPLAATLAAPYGYLPLFAVSLASSPPTGWSVVTASPHFHGR